ncbi:hypothetical protein K491DRAFT_45241 [Lophiostoma macrostomum CBS 122681]|uniref:Uncharacterized protein n=1 Tax=Lophiostoma macrostomum CBS 122681 TaxID=1314788 RepID=A0A6A6SXY3_9PLEO|nr:hypothetical protein K491DRAFT_45241 [Lophiostoma macrostomum CBS 122681]
MCYIKKLASESLRMFWWSPPGRRAAPMWSRLSRRLHHGKRTDTYLSPFRRLFLPADILRAILIRRRKSSRGRRPCDIKVCRLPGAIHAEDEAGARLACLPSFFPFSEAPRPASRRPSGSAASPSSICPPHRRRSWQMSALFATGKQFLLRPSYRA